MSRLALLLATWFGCGYFPWGPGTAGSVAALAIAVFLHAYLHAGRGTLLVLVAALLGPAIWAAGRAAQITGKHDPGLVVVDEVLGQWLALAGASVLNARTLIAGFVLFRLFDIWKPWPVSRCEHLPGGWGIVADDLAAGICAALILYISGKAKLY